jgi:hypothetical protein
MVKGISFFPEKSGEITDTLPIEVKENFHINWDV